MRPFHTLLNPIAVAAEGASLLPATQRDAIVQSNLQALSALRHRRAQFDDIKRLSLALMMADTLAAVAPLARANRPREIAAGIDALAAITRRHARHYAYIAQPDELDAISDALAVHHIQVEHATVSEIERAQEKIDAMVQSKFGRAA
ncbi:MAG: hypothetical protein KGL42_08615 [Betaproteobacteria bacterium]|nr:hypothetical protein [Betaproteobacteria bacterium]